MEQFNAPIFEQKLLFGLDDALKKLPEKEVFFIIQKVNNHEFLEDVGNGQKIYTDDFKEAIYFENFKNALDYQTQYNGKLRKVVKENDVFKLSSWNSNYKPTTFKGKIQSYYDEGNVVIDRLPLNELNNKQLTFLGKLKIFKPYLLNIDDSKFCNIKSDDGKILVEVGNFVSESIDSRYYLITFNSDSQRKMTLIYENE